MLLKPEEGIAIILVYDSNLSQRIENTALYFVCSSDKAYVAFNFRSLPIKQSQRLASKTVIFAKIVPLTKTALA